MHLPAVQSMSPLQGVAVITVVLITKLPGLLFPCYSRSGFKLRAHFLKDHLCFYPSCLDRVHYFSLLIILPLFAAGGSGSDKGSCSYQSSICPSSSFSVWCASLLPGARLELPWHSSLVALLPWLSCRFFLLRFQGNDLSKQLLAHYCALLVIFHCLAWEIQFWTSFCRKSSDLPEI